MYLRAALGFWISVIITLDLWPSIVKVGISGINRVEYPNCPKQPGYNWLDGILGLCNLTLISDYVRLSFFFSNTLQQYHSGIESFRSFLQNFRGFKKQVGSCNGNSEPLTLSMPKHKQSV